MDTSFRAALMSADTGANETYDFQADAGLFQLPADDIVRRFMEHLNSTRENGERPFSYELDSAVKKAEKQIVLATGSLLLEKGELPFLLMLSPDPRPSAAGGEIA